MAPPARALMIQGTGSDVGKSLIVAGLCRLFARRGLTVRPFKPQNMSNNAAVTADGGEIGRAQALQARAAGALPTVHMNPILLKPEADTGAQVVVQGRRATSLSARDYMAARPRLMPQVLDSFRTLAGEADLVLVEGAGSPAEVNLRAGDIANMGFAEAADIPVVLCADIHRGGVIAALVGTATVIAPDEAARIRGYLINKMRGDPTLFADGVGIIARHTGWPCFGIVPHYPGANRLPAEDAMEIRSRPRGDGDEGRILVAVPQLSRIANFDDLDPLAMEPGVAVDFVSPGAPLPADAALVLLPGSKSTLGDLAFFREQGWDIDLAAHVRRGGRVLGLCGGYQMLGRRLSDPHGVDGAPGEAPGLGLLDLETTMEGDKSLAEVTGQHLPSGCPIAGYEMHMGRTTGPDRARPLVELDGAAGPRPDGARSADGRVDGCYVHGLFASGGFRRAYLAELGAATGPALDYGAEVDRALDGLADLLAQTLDIEALLAAAGPVE